MEWTHQYQGEYDDRAQYNFDPWAHGPSHHDPCLHHPMPLERFFQDRQDPWHVRQPDVPHFDSSPLQAWPQMVFPSDPYVNRVSSPSDSGPSSTDMGSGMSDYNSDPSSSPPCRAATYVPVSDLSSMHITLPCYVSQHDMHCGGGVVALHDVQFKADYQPEASSFEEDHSTMLFSGLSAPEEGYQERVDTPQYDNCDIKCEIEHVEVPSVESTESDAAPPNMRQRRPSKSRTITSPVMSARVSKRSSGTRRRSSSSIKSPTKEVVNASASNRSFPCVFARYGCQSTFGNKNEWKRHVVTQHMRPCFWRCDLCETTNDRKPNDFNRKDLFIQHIRRMHDSAIIPSSSPKSTATGGPRSPRTSPEDQQLALIATRCYIQTRSLPEESACHFCDARFKGRHTWEERMEHVGTHMEALKKEGGEPTDPATWRDDAALHEYLRREGIVERRGKGWGLIGGGVGK